MTSTDAENRAERVLVVAPVGRDAFLIQRTLAQAGFTAEGCADLGELSRQLEAGVGAALLTVEALGPSAIQELLAALDRQPAWSDLPLIVLTSSTLGPRSANGAMTALEAGANVTLLERPVQVQTLVSATRAALRARRRQYDTRTLLAREQAARAELEAASRAKDEFLATLSHELRTPLNAMLGWARMLRTGAVPKDKREHAVEIIERNAQAQTQLIEDLLDVSRIITGNLRLHVGSVDIKRVAELALDVVRPAADAKGIQLEATLDEGAGPVLGDAGRLQQVVWNLLTNAVKFTQRGGRVQITMRRAASSAELAVEDNGQGIAAEFLPHVFERFRQADGSITRAHGGLGLGLAIVRHLVELHGGTIEAHSEGKGHGATFVVRIPVAPLRESPVEPRRDSPAPAAPTTHPSCSPELTGLRIVVVDDDATSLSMIAAMLEHCQAQVVPVATAADALDAIRREAPDVLISDIGMPVADGYALIRGVRALAAEKGKSTPAVALTAYTQTEDRTLALRAGFDVHVAKPVEPAELIAVLARLTGRAST